MINDQNLSIGSVKRNVSDRFAQLKDAGTLAASEEYAQVTCANIFTKQPTFLTEGNRQGIERDTQSLGALLVNNLTAKVAEMLLPVDTPFFKIEPTATVLQMASVVEGLKLEKMVGTELRATQRMFLNGGYAELTRAIQLLIVTGNALVLRDEQNKKFITYDLNNYALRRDNSGQVVELVVREHISLESMTEEERARVQLNNDPSLNKRVELYTHCLMETVEVPIQLDNGIESTVRRQIYNVTQYVNNLPVSDTIKYPIGLFPFIPLAWRLVQGENYGRGYVEDYISDFARYSELSDAVMDYEIGMMKFLNLVPASLITAEDLIEQDNGAFVPVNGTGGAPTVLEGGDAQKLSQVIQDMSLIEQRLSRAFMYTGIQRDAERVTAEEVRAQTREAQYTLGQAFTTLSADLHPRLATLLITETDKELYDLIETECVQIDITVGLATLNRANKVTKLQYAANAAQMIIPVFAQVSQRFNTEKVIDIILEGYGLDAEEFLFTEEEMKQRIEEQQQQMQEQQQQLQATPETNSEQLGLTE